MRPSAALACAPARRGHVCGYWLLPLLPYRQVAVRPVPVMAGWATILSGILTAVTKWQGLIPPATAPAAARLDMGPDMGSDMGAWGAGWLVARGQPAYAPATGRAGSRWYPSGSERLAATQARAPAWKSPAAPGDSHAPVATGREAPFPDR